ncbi:hypothetical protein DFP72DRAFT_852367 [Ephemerocybe angulata]|uniref:Uncharacterized protein n=1 Tax=Ephemerocybe angulata TaxID=980116 RepID=A0A8H6HM02_9AGAR|nr:hypothetical protein DFP72DRAFT_852367 [Tulosesus angulatus]
MECIGGLIYLRDISQDRFGIPARRNLDRFNSICGEDALSRVVMRWLGLWGEGRRTLNQALGFMVGKGASIRRLRDNDEAASALEIVHYLLDKTAPSGCQEPLDKTLLIEKELVKNDADFRQTTVAQTYRSQHQELIQTKEMLQAKESAAQGDEEVLASIRAQIQELALGRTRFNAIDLDSVWDSKAQRLGEDRTIKRIGQPEREMMLEEVHASLGFAFLLWLMVLCDCTVGDRRSWMDVGGCAGCRNRTAAVLIRHRRSTNHWHAWIGLRPSHAHDTDHTIVLRVIRFCPRASHWHQWQDAL